MKYLLLCLIFCLSVQGHQSSLSQLHIDMREDTLHGHLNVSVLDLNMLLGLDDDFDASISWKEIKNHENKILALAQTHLGVDINKNACVLDFKPLMIEKLNSDTYVHLGFTSACTTKDKYLDISYSLLFDRDADHKSYVSIQTQTKTITELFSSNTRKLNINIYKDSKLKSFLIFIKEGIVHIFLGFDHILFLLALLLPAGFTLVSKRYQKNENFKISLIGVLKLVTAFTVAHSITLSLSVLGLISMPSWLIESIIAASVVLAALNNIKPIVGKSLWVLVFAFGLIHGMGFASVLMELGLNPESQFLCLLGFNIGVELGQVLIITLLLPLIYSLSKQNYYKRYILELGSFLICIMGCVWLFERLEFLF